MGRLLLTCVLALAVVASCSKSPSIAVGANPNAQSSGNSSQSVNAKYREVQLDFNGHSTEGGFILAYFDAENRLSHFEIYLLGELGKTVYRCDAASKDRVLVTETRYEYEKSIDESNGDVKIASKKDRNFTVINQNQIEPKDDKTLLIYKSAMAIIAK